MKFLKLLLNYDIFTRKPLSRLSMRQELFVAIVCFAGLMMFGLVCYTLKGNFDFPEYRKYFPLLDSFLFFALSFGCVNVIIKNLILINIAKKQKKHSDNAIHKINLIFYILNWTIFIVWAWHGWNMLQIAHSLIKHK